MNEAETRAEHIDPALKLAGRGVVEGNVVNSTTLPGNVTPPPILFP